MGQCGLGHTTTPVWRPRKVLGLDGVPVQQVSAGTSHSCACTAPPRDRYVLMCVEGPQGHLQRRALRSVSEHHEESRGKNKIEQMLFCYAAVLNCVTSCVILVLAVTELLRIPDFNS